MGNNSFFDNIPPVVKNLVIVNFLIWLLCITLQKVHLFGDFDFYNFFTLHYWESSEFMPIQIFSYMFLHSIHDISHVFFNMFSLFMLGTTIERIWGPKRFIYFYITCGIGAALTQEVVWTIQLMGMDLGQYIDHYRPDLMDIKGMMDNGVLMHTVNTTAGPISSATELRAYLLNMFGTVGASGAVFGIMLAFAMIFPNAPLYLMFIPIPIKAKYMVGFYAILELVFGVVATGDGIAHYAHLGGMLFGLLLIMKWRKDATNY